MATRGRPRKAAADKRTDDIKIPLSGSEKQQIQAAAEADEEKPVTWARNTLLRAAKRRIK